MIDPRIIVAIDTHDYEDAVVLLDQLNPELCKVKIGSVLFNALGKDFLRLVDQRGFKIFLDLKLHDIPNTVAKAIHSLMRLHPKIITIHTAGGYAMMMAAANAATEAAAQECCPRPLIVGVTILTSLDEADLTAIGYQDSLPNQVLKMAKLAKKSGLDGVVCSPHEIELIRDTCGPDFKLVVPGIRPAGSRKGDQKRVMTPKEAINLGADFLVIGRPITQADDPVAAVRAIVEEINS